MMIVMMMIIITCLYSFNVVDDKMEDDGDDLVYR